MKTIIANKSWLAESDLRLDASFHLSDGRLTSITFKKANIKTSPLHEVTQRIFYGGRSRRIYVNRKENGIPFIKGADIVKADFSPLKMISRKRTANLDEYFLEEGWTLITRSGTIGNTAYVNKDFIHKAASDDIIRVVPKSIPSGFLYAFLSSKYGQALIKHGTYGAVIQHIEPEHIANLPVPIFTTDKQEEIHSLIVQAADLRVEANRLLEEAITLFEEKIGIHQVVSSHQTEVLQIKEIKSFLLRLDSQYQIGMNKIKKEKKTIDYRTIKSLAANITVGNRSKRNYVENGIPFLSSSDMILFNPKRYAKQISIKTGGIENLLVKRNSILISRSGTVGNVVFVGNDLSQTAISEHAMRLEIDSLKIDPAYIFCYLSTQQGQSYMKSSAFGSVIITLNEDLIGNIEVPILDTLTQKNISDKIYQYQENLDSATIKENKAIQLVEKEIDQWQQ
ncbi:type I restriction-modification system restriction endonuclease DNA specificity subunit HsdS [Bacteroidia bacterium]|uniref:Restriction endonuclease subunit S n=1 Tax=Dysgonomonas termitidis TaxID=1516126 RepID=A0ABV9L3M9_9BACT|nr:type I restriction-modification system restriction endonuclease DNA specificity subunit HsdS [Bacteroidia bacterium]GHV41166.1 type I restriction-modification system restriction endonuclease DNA specificity subunit HsdS [Bacteroidia bacterium]